MEYEPGLGVLDELGEACDAGAVGLAAIEADTGLDTGGGDELVTVEFWAPDG